MKLSKTISKSETVRNWVSVKQRMNTRDAILVYWEYSKRDRGPNQVIAFTALYERGWFVLLLFYNRTLSKLIYSCLLTLWLYCQKCTFWAYMFGPTHYLVRLSQQQKINKSLRLGVKWEKELVILVWSPISPQLLLFSLTFLLRAPLECYKLFDFKHPGKACLLLRMTQAECLRVKKNATSVQKKDCWRLAEIQYQIGRNPGPFFTFYKKLKCFKDVRICTRLCLPWHKNICYVVKKRLKIFNTFRKEMEETLEEC